MNDYTDNDVGRYNTWELCINRMDYSPPDVDMIEEVIKLKKKF